MEKKRIAHNFMIKQNENLFEFLNARQISCRCFSKMKTSKEQVQQLFVQQMFSVRKECQDSLFFSSHIYFARLFFFRPRARARAVPVSNFPPNIAVEERREKYERPDKRAFIVFSPTNKLSTSGHFIRNDHKTVRN